MATAHFILVALYAVLPAGACVVPAARAWKAGRLRPLVPCLLTFVTALVLSAGICLAYAGGIDARARAGQVLVTAYFLAGVLTILKGVRWICRVGFDRLFRVSRGPDGKAIRPRGAGAVASAAASLAVLLLLGMPYLLAAVMTWRPKVSPTDDPKT